MTTKGKKLPAYLWHRSLFNLSCHCQYFTLGNSADSFLVLHKKQVSVLGILLLWRFQPDHLVSPTGSLSDGGRTKPDRRVAGLCVYLFLVLRSKAAGSVGAVQLMGYIMGWLMVLPALVATGSEVCAGQHGTYHAVIGLLAFPLHL